MNEIRRLVGVGAAGLLIFVVGGGLVPAGANHVREPVCNTLASQVAQATTGANFAGIAMGNAEANLASRLASLEASRILLVQTAVQLVDAHEAGQNLALAQSIFDSAISDYVNQAVAYVNAAGIRDGAVSDHTFKVQTRDILAGMASGLGCAGVTNP